MMIQRPFSSGSRQAPDPHDNFLEEAGFYRKHTARDSSCLFRTISEQMYDTQNHHLTIRESCVSYMRKNKLYFQNCLKQYTYDVDIDEYLDELSKIKTFGTLLELEAMAHMFARNIVLFRPLELGQWFIYKPQFENKFQVFVSRDRHFDTVYENNFIEDAAFCQSVVYELLYKHVFKLPDITYAVERMLHASSFDEISTTNEGMYCREICLKDGRTFKLDMPDNTCCILNNYELCHFHNTNFSQMTEILQHEVNKFDSSYVDTKSTNSELWSSNGSGCNYNSTSYFYENGMSENEYYDCNERMRQLDSLLREKYISCVRQLLYEGITPFPYKVAKALDPDMYRNIEFDSWSEMRKEQRWKNWYTGGNSLQVGVKCQVYLRKQDEFYTGYIQEMPETQNGLCVVFIEDLGEKRTVPYDCLKPLPPDQIKPWPLPYRWQKQFDKYQQNQMYSSAKFFNSFSSHQTKCKIVEFDTNDIMQSYPLEHQFSDKDNINFKLKQYCSLDNFTSSAISSPFEIIALPLSIENDRTPLSSNIKIARQTPLNAAVHTNKMDETPSRPSSTQLQQQQQTLQLEPSSQTQNSQQEIIESTYLEENIIPIEQGSTIAISAINDGSCQYPVYNYSEPYYAYQFDNSIIHAAAGGQQYYCVVPTSGSNVVQHTGQPGVFMTPNHQLSPTMPCASVGTINGSIANVGYYSTSGTQAYFPASTVLQPVISQPISSGRHLINNNVNFAVQKSVMESGVDLPNDVTTLRFFFNLGWDYYNDLNGAKSKDGDDATSKLAIEFKKIKIENESANQEKTDSNNNILTNKNMASENIDQHTYQNQQSSNNNNYQIRNNNLKYNTNNNTNRGVDNKHFNSRCFNNRKPGNFNRNNGVANTGRFVQGSQNGRNNAGNHSHNSRNDNRNSNMNSGSKGLGSNKLDSYKKTVNSGTGSEPDSSNITDNNCNNKIKESLENGNQICPISTTSENNELNQTPTVPQSISQSITSTTSATSYNVPYYTDHSNLCASDQLATLAPFSTGSNTNGNIFVPQVITPVPFGLCQTVPPPNTPTNSYNSFQSTVSHNTNYPYISGQSGPINTSHPPPPLPTAGATISQAGCVPITQATYPIQTQPLQQQSYYYPFTPQGPPSGNNSSNTNVSESSSPSSGVGGANVVDFNVMNYTPEYTGPYPVMNFPVYYTPTNNGGLTPTGSNSTNNHIQVNGNAYQGYWIAPAPLPQQVRVTTPSSNNKNNINGNPNISH